MPRLLGPLFLAAFALAFPVHADGPSDNQQDRVRPMPPKGIAIPDDQRQALETKLATLGTLLAELTASKDPFILESLPDVEIFHRAVDLALRDDGFFEPQDAARAEDLLREGESRAQALKTKTRPWRFPSSSRSVYATVRGFRSRLDGTAQPYGVVMNVVDSDRAANPGGVRGDVWCRGRSEKGLELQFLATRMKNTDPMPERGVIMIHPFGRYCNANKLAGEIDTLEAIEHATREYRIDPKRIAIRGFSMGGAAAWHLAVHYPDRWFAATPGAGFSETPEFLNVFQSESLQPFWFERKLWQCYDCPVWVRNLRMLPTIAYSGALDKQKQAADVMAKAAWELPESERFELAHIIAPNTAHQISPDARAEIERRLRGLDSVRTGASPERFTFTTATLRYHRAHWLTIDALTEHWVPSTVHAERRQEGIFLWLDPGVRQFTLNIEPTDLPESQPAIGLWIHFLDDSGTSQVKRFVQAQAIPRRSDMSWGATFRFANNDWERVSPIEPPNNTLMKKHQLQGPIDDAFMAPFLFVRPTAEGMHPETDAWVKNEFDRAVLEWRRQMRGEVRIKNSEELTQEDLQKYHLVLWGDPVSNPTLAKVLEKLPLKWSNKSLHLGERSYEGKTHMPILIYPNPLAPDRYVVLNSSFTYREYDYLNNARQVPKLPDWAIVDITTPPNPRWPGRIADADFFDERWQLKPLKPLLE